MTQENVAITKLAGSTDTVDLSITTLISQADPVVTFVMIMLVLFSIWCWAIIFDKWMFFKTAKLKTSSFERDYASAKSNSSLYEKLRKYKNNPTTANYKHNNPMSAMFISGMRAILKYEDKKTGASIEHLRELVYHSVQKTKNNDLEKMEKDLIILATIGSAAPFIGLFGTVWGIVNSFQSIAAAKNTTLAVVAPGIAEALLATGIGLFAAIPAVVFYNLFSNEIRKFAIKLDEFGNEIVSVLVVK